MINLQQSLLKLKQKKSCSKVAVDIGNSNLKIAILSTKEGIVKLDNFIIRPIEKKENLAELIKESFAKLSINIKNINISLSGEGVFLRYVFMPRMSKEELDSSICLEASKYIPMPVEKVFLDSTILKNDFPDNKMLVLVASVDKAILEDRLKLIKDCGLSVDIVDVDSLAVINAFNYFYYVAHKDKADKQDKDSVAVLDIGARKSSLSILQDGIPYFTRTIGIAGDEFDKRIAESFKVSNAEARMMKEGISEGTKSDFLNILNGVINDLSNEIQISFDYFESHFNAAIKKIFLLSGGAKTFGLKDGFSKLLEIEVIEPDISEGILFPEQIKDELKKNSYLLAVALGLGIRDD